MGPMKIYQSLGVNPITTRLETMPISKCYPNQIHQTSAPQSSSSNNSLQKEQPSRTASSCTQSNGTGCQPRNWAHPPLKHYQYYAPPAPNTISGSSRSTCQQLQLQATQQQTASCSTWARSSSCSMTACSMFKHRVCY